jgi:hypothetical protein
MAIRAIEENREKLARACVENPRLAINANGHDLIGQFGKNQR